MTKIKKIFKWLVIILAPISVLYIALWFKLVSDFCKIFNANYSGPPVQITKNYNVSFKKAAINLNLLTISIKLYEFTEDTDNSIVKHTEPLTIGYNILLQHIYTHYKGESVANYKPLNSGFGAKVNGEYKVSIDLPLSFKLIEILRKEDGLFEATNFLNNLEINFSNVVVKDLVDEKVIVGDAGAHFNLRIDHHKYYKTAEELLISPPQDFNVKFKAHSKDIGTLPLIMPSSVIYGYFPAYPFKYAFKAHFHTEAKQVTTVDLIKNLRLTVENMEYSDALQDSSSNAQFESNIQEKNLDCGINYSTKLKLYTGYSKVLENTLRVISKMLPSIAETQDLKRILATIDVANLDINTGDHPITINLKSNFKEQNGKLSLEIGNLEIDYQNTGFTLSCNLGKDENKNLNSSGTLAISDYNKFIDYATSAYFTMNQYSDNGDFDSNFYKEINKVFFKQIADSSDDNSIAIKYNISKDSEKSQIGKVKWPEATLLYYVTIFKKIKQSIKDPQEALAKFKTIVPEYILEQKTLDKIIAAQ